MYRKYIKRLCDIIVSLILLLLLSPLMLLLIILMGIVLRGNPFFVQRRPGKDECIFKLLKFRTMTDERDAKGALLPDAERLTPMGRLIRSTSMDELPQLINVLSGSMSLVGPRPLLVRYLKLYSPDHARRHEVRPGITGWAQVNGRNAISWQERLDYDVYYVDNVSFIFDIKIVLITFLKVFRRSGISSESSATMEPFTGSKY